MLLRRMFFLLAVTCLLACPALAQDLSGRWYGEGYQGRRYLHWISERRPDGGFFVEFRQYNECHFVSQQKEAGRWNYANGIYSTTTTMVDGRRVDYADSYTLLGLNGDIMEYRHIRSGMQFKARRVDADFEWPSCDKSKLTS